MGSRLQVRWGNSPLVTTPSWGPPPSCEQALIEGLKLGTFQTGRIMLFTSKSLPFASIYRFGWGSQNHFRDQFNKTFTSVAIILYFENNGYTCKLHL